MYNLQTAQHSARTAHQQQLQKSRSEAWMAQYRSIVRPQLVSKHDRRITGFAKKMECQPFIMPQQQSQVKPKSGRTQGSQLAVSMGKLSSPSRKMAKTSTKIKIQSKPEYTSEAYNRTAHSFRQRQKQMQINPPMRYGCQSGNKYLVKMLRKSQSAQKKKKASLSNMSKMSKVSRLSKVSKDDMHSTISDNYSEYDTIDLNNILLQSQIRSELNEKQKKEKEDEQLKALSQNKLYFKSLIEYQARMKDKCVKGVLKDILVKCRVFKPAQHKAKQESDKDLFAQVMKANLTSTQGSSK